MRQWRSWWCGGGDHLSCHGCQGSGNVDRRHGRHGHRHRRGRHSHAACLCRRSLRGCRGQNSPWSRLIAHEKLVPAFVQALILVVVLRMRPVMELVVVAVVVSAECFR